jgi:hypothetical protein
MKGLANNYSQGKGMNSKNYRSYVKSKEKSMKKSEEQVASQEKVVNIKDFQKIEILNSNGKIVAIFDITRFDGVAKFS